jgi:hypothetical protein
MSRVEYWKLSNVSANITVAILRILDDGNTVFAETLDNYQYSTHLTPESQSFTLNASR